jgi:alpha-1,2-mannosyltransferase
MNLLRRHARALYAAAALVAACLLLYRGMIFYESVMNTRAYDLGLDWAGARVLAQGLNPYSPEGLKAAGMSPDVGFGHPPTTFVWFLPLASFDLPAAKRIWNELTIVFLFVQLMIMVLELRLPSPLVTVPLLAGAVLSTTWMRDHLHVSQLSTFIALLYAVAWYHLRHERDVLAGIALGLATTLKFYPGVVVLLLFLCGRWRTAIAAGATWGLLAAAVTAKIGLHAWKQFFDQAQPYTIYWITHVRNSSIQGIMQRVHYRLCVYRPAHHLVWPPGAWAATVISLALGGGVWRLGRRDAAPGGGAIDLPYALFVCVSLITGPYMWEHYNVTLVLPFLIAGVAVERARRGGLAPAWATAGFLALAAVVGMLAININVKNWYWDGYYAKPQSSHLLLHVFEVLSWAPTPSLIALLGLLIAWSHRRAPAAFRALAFD